MIACCTGFICGLCHFGSSFELEHWDTPAGKKVHPDLAFLLASAVAAVNRVSAFRNVAALFNYCSLAILLL